MYSGYSFSSFRRPSTNTNANNLQTYSASIQPPYAVKREISTPETYNKPSLVMIQAYDRRRTIGRDWGRESFCVSGCDNRQYAPRLWPAAKPGSHSWDSWSQSGLRDKNQNGTGGIVFLEEIWLSFCPYKLPDSLNFTTHPTTQPSLLSPNVLTPILPSMGLCFLPSYHHSQRLIPEAPSKCQRTSVSVPLASIRWECCCLWTRPLWFLCEVSRKGWAHVFLTFQFWCWLLS